jgi:hypothetical protein
MPRPKGSKNKPKPSKYEIVKGNDCLLVKVKMEKQVENSPLTRDSRRGWINFGSRNMYPIELSNLYYNSPTHKACVDFEVSSILGDGVDYEAMRMDETKLYPNYQETWNEFIQKIALDYAIFGSYAFQIIRNKDGKSYSFYHQPISDVRCSPRDEDGVIMSYWISGDWSAQSKFPPIEIKAFGFQEDEEIKSGEPYLFVYSSYSPDIQYYQLPQYASAIKAIQTEIELVRYDLRSVLNNFTASGVLSMNRIDNDEERKMVLDNIEAMFTGSDSANSLMVAFKDNDENTPVVFTKFDKDVNNVNLFDGTNTRLVDRIVSAHRIPSKALIGLNVDSAMLGGEGNLINVAYNLYLKTKGINDRNAIISVINKMLSINGIDEKIILKPLSFNVTDGNANPADTVSNVGRTTEYDEERITSNNELI